MFCAFIKYPKVLKDAQWKNNNSEQTARQFLHAASQQTKVKMPVKAFSDIAMKRCYLWHDIIYLWSSHFLAANQIDSEPER